MVNQQNCIENEGEMICLKLQTEITKKNQAEGFVKKQLLLDYFTNIWYFYKKIKI